MAHAQAKVPRRQIPPTVLAELSHLENRFELALATDCKSNLCYTRGCAYVDHAVIDRPRATSLPGLGGGPGPGSIEPQEFLTQARCSFAHEPSIPAEDAQALVRRLQSKVSSGFVVVSVDRQELLPRPDTLQDLPPEGDEDAEAPEPVVPVPEAWSAAVAGRELWTHLLPHFAWMIAVLLLTAATSVLFWAWRRVGKESIEERMLLAQMLREEEEGVERPSSEDGSAEGSDGGLDEVAFVAEQDALWGERLALAASGTPDLELQALVRELLRAGDMPLLAKAVLRFPESFLSSFPDGGDIAQAKLDLAEVLKTVDEDTLPSDGDLFRSLNRHARAATLSTHSDAQLVRSLREDFGAAGLVALISQVPARAAALLFALSPAADQHEMVRLMAPSVMEEMSEQLLRSNRMDASETEYLFEVLGAARAGGPLPGPSRRGDVSDRGAPFDAAAALSVLLPALADAPRQGLFRAALQRFSGSVPAWYRSIFTGRMLLALPAEARSDVLLEVDVETLAAWMSMQGADVRQAISSGLPSALRASVEGSSDFPSRDRQVALAERGRRDLARSFQVQLARRGVSFEEMLFERGIRNDPEVDA